LISNWFLANNWLQPYGTAHAWVAEWRATGNFGNKERRSQLKDHRDWLDKLVTANPAMTTGEIIKAMERVGRVK
jgi:hypothetical protein